MLSATERRIELAAFLGAGGVDPQDLTNEVERVYGPVRLVTATGSVLAGLGTENSDIDVLVIVECDRLTDLPLVSYSKMVRVDVEYITLADFLSMIDAVSNADWRSDGAPEARAKHQRALRYLTRVAVGSVLEIDGMGMAAALESLNEPWLKDAAARTHRLRAEQFRAAARWSYDARPLVACNRYFEAIRFALESRNAAQGHVFEGPKWVVDKLRALHDENGEAVMSWALRSPRDPRGAQIYREVAEEHLGTLLSIDEVTVEIEARFNPSVRVRRLGRGTLVTLHDSIGHLCDGFLPTEPQPLWRGKCGQALPSTLQPLFLDGMLLAMAVESAQQGGRA